ncbi:MAG: flagellar basal body L-ring protein FlgH [Desulfobacteraceae bacterium]
MYKSIWAGPAILIAVLFFFSGCLGLQADLSAVKSADDVPDGLSKEPAVQPEYSSKRPSEGSLFSAQSRFFFEDNKAARVGDTVIVDIVENSSSSMEVNTESGRTTEMNAGVGRLFGNMTAFGATDAGKLIGTNFENSFEGEAESDRSGQVTASIAARIKEILPNGNFSIYGSRSMKVDNEVQYIIISGVARPGDIGSDNRVESVSLADSRIEYYGKGALADKQKPGWGTRIIDNLWPF